MLDRPRAYTTDTVREESWYGGVLAPTASRDDSGEPVLAAERQGNLIGVAPAL